MLKRCFYVFLVLLVTLAITFGSFGCAEPAPTPTPPSPSPSPTPTPTPPKPTPTPAKPIELKFNNPWPPTHHLATEVCEPWGKFVEEKTGGRVKIHFYHGGALGKTGEVWDHILGGMYDISIWVPVYKRDKFPLTLICELPFSFPDNVVGDKVFASMLDKYALSEYDEVKFGARLTTDLYQLWSTKKISSLEDMKGMKLRVPGAGWKPVVDAWGATAVSIKPEDMYLSLDRGILDGVIYGLLGGWGWKLQETSPYLTRIDAQLIVGNYIMNKDSWNKLPKDIQEIFDKEIWPELTALTTKDYVDGQDKTWNDLKEFGTEIITLSPEEMAKWRESTTSVWDEWIKHANSKGHPGEEVMAYYKQLLKAEGILIE